MAVYEAAYTCYRQNYKLQTALIAQYCNTYALCTPQVQDMDDKISTCYNGAMI